MTDLQTIIERNKYPEAHHRARKTWFKKHGKSLKSIARGASSSKK